MSECFAYFFLGVFMILGLKFRTLVKLDLFFFFNVM